MNINLGSYSVTELYTIRELAAHGFDIQSVAWGKETADEILPRCEQEIDRRQTIIRSFRDMEAA